LKALQVQLRLERVVLGLLQVLAQQQELELLPVQQAPQVLRQLQRAA
jgi:hypothetical protein